MITFSNREFQFMSSYTNDMYQSGMLRTGPMGPMIIEVRSKFLALGPVDLTPAEQQFLLFAINDTFVTTHSAIVKSQMGMSMQYLRPDTRPRTVSSISDLGTATADGLSGTYLTEWDIMKGCMAKLGMVVPPPYKPLRAGPDGDPDAISTPMHHDINDGTGYNHR
jgi:hypothetical protein